MLYSPNEFCDVLTLEKKLVEVQEFKGRIKTLAPSDHVPPAIQVFENLKDTSHFYQGNQKDVCFVCYKSEILPNGEYDITARNLPSLKIKWPGVESAGREVTVLLLTEHWGEWRRALIQKTQHLPYKDLPCLRKDAMTDARKDLPNWENYPAPGEPTLLLEP